MKLQATTMTMQPAAAARVTVGQVFCRMGSTSTWLLMLYSLATMGILFAIGGQPLTAHEGFEMLRQS